MMYNSCKEGIQTAKSDNQDQLAEASILVTAILNFVRVLIEVNQRAARIKGGRKARTIPQRDHNQKGQKLSKRKIYEVCFLLSQCDHCNPQRVDDLLRHKNAAHQAGGLILTYN